MKRIAFAIGLQVPLLFLAYTLSTAAFADDNKLERPVPVLPETRTTPPIATHTEITKEAPPVIEIQKLVPTTLVQNQPWRVYFKLTNNGALKRILNGTVQATATDQATAALFKSSEKKIRDLQTDNFVEGYIDFKTTGQMRNGSIELAYSNIDKPMYNPLTKQTVGDEALLSHCFSDFTAIADEDLDGVDDELEHRLLERFRPYYMFSNDGGDEDYRPTNVRWYLTQSNLHPNGDQKSSPLLSNQTLQGNPSAILFSGSPSSYFLEYPHPTDYHVNPLENIPGANHSFPGRNGSDWDEVMAKKNVGLYGHVVPVQLRNTSSADRYSFDFESTLTASDQTKTYYKIEYWQFFGYNGAHKANIGDHEGDWTSVQLIYDPEADLIRSVFHFAHGTLFRFNITAENNVRNVSKMLPDGECLEYHGASSLTTPLDLNLASLILGGIPPRIETNDDQVALAQNNILRMFKDPSTGLFTHPVVYIENGTHEFFPSEYWDYYGAPNHNGKSVHHYLCATPPNLGEVDYPLRETDEAKAILWFNGSWGLYGYQNDPPHGPVLHKNWTLFPGSISEKNRTGLRLGF